MKISAQLWWLWAAKVMPKSSQAWLTAMKAECREIPNASERETFAAGCFSAALLERVRNRKTLNYMARAIGAAGLVGGSSLGIKAAMDMANNPAHAIAAKIIFALCLFYICGAALLVASLKGLKIYATCGLALAAFSWVYIQIRKPDIQTIPAEFIAALNIETMALMASLLFAATYLGWLYTPHFDDA